MRNSVSGWTAPRASAGAARTSSRTARWTSSRDYRLTSRLGDGGQGLVFKAERAGRFFVIKFFQARELDAWGLMEVSSLQKFKHPNIVRVRGYDRWPDPDHGYFYIVMEWVDGLTLEQYALLSLSGNPSPFSLAQPEVS
ncbi:hypothetical protein [Archangium minus]|uniref:protein kinase domain-containing protein n=1 Tax=Archangium minus TaxID=83450 RepID=UPI0037BEF3AF